SSFVGIGIFVRHVGGGLLELLKFFAELVEFVGIVRGFAHGTFERIHLLLQFRGRRQRAGAGFARSFLHALKGRVLLQGAIFLIELVSNIREVAQCIGAREALFG